MARLGIFVLSLFVNAFFIALGAVVLVIGYWLSDEVYAAGLWPLGALMRIILLFMVIGFVIGIVGRIIGSLLTLVARD